jgi:hypothetical protein
MSSPPLVYLGRISYGTYLWHWLVIVVAMRSFELSPTSSFIVASVIASGLAALSYQLVESPVRHARWLDRHKRPVVVLGLASSLLVGIVIAPRILDRSHASASVTRAGGTLTSGMTPVPADLDWRGAQADHGAFPPCPASKWERCILVHGTGKRVLLIGDSNARMYISMLTAMAEDRNLTLAAAVAPGCPWQQGILRRGQVQVGTTLQDLGPPCAAHHAEWYDTIIAALDPDIVIAVNEPLDDPTSPRPIQDEQKGPVDAGTDAFNEVVQDRTTQAVQRFVADGRKVVMIEPIPLTRYKDDPLNCLAQAKFLDECRFVTGTKPTEVETIYRRVAAQLSTSVFSVDLDHLVCPYLPICDPVVNGLIVRRDPEHLTDRFAASLVKPFERILDDHGLLQ